MIQARSRPVGRTSIHCKEILQCSTLAERGSCWLNRKIIYRHSNIGTPSRHMQGAGQVPSYTETLWQCLIMELMRMIKTILNKISHHFWQHGDTSIQIILNKKQAFWKTSISTVNKRKLKLYGHSKRANNFSSYKFPLYAKEEEVD